MKKGEKQNSLALVIIVSVILIVMIVSIVNVGMTLIKERPEWDDYCIITKPVEEVKTQGECQVLGGEWVEYNVPIEQQDVNGKVTMTRGYCDMYKECQEAHEQANRKYNQLQFYVFVGIGFLLLLFGLYTPSTLLQYTSLGAGGILFLEGVVINFENKVVVFISLIVILGIFGYIAKRILEK